MMINKQLIERINYLANKRKKEGLTPSEIEEQQKLRLEYIKEFKKGVKAQLDNIEVVN